MQTITLGKSSLVTSRLAYGCWRIFSISSPDQVTPERDAAARKAVTAAYEAGYTLFDLADVYSGGAAETVFGKVLKEVSGMREKIVLVSKCAVRKKGDPDNDAPYRYDFSRDHILRSCEGSLQRLGVDTLDVFLLHRPDFLMDPAEVASALSALREQGKVREFGVSNFNPSQFAVLQKACPFPLLVNQVQMSLLAHAPLTDGTLDQCMAERVTPMAWSPLNGGRLVTEWPLDITMPGHALRIGVRETLDRLGRRHGASRMQMALAWLMRHPAGIQPIIGSSNPDNIRAAVKATEINLSREDWYELLQTAMGERLP